MGRLIFPSEVMRGYLLRSNEYSTRDDEFYYLCIGTDLQIFCLIYYSPNKMYSRAYWSSRIEAHEFGQHNVEGGNILVLARRKLAQLLPERT